MMYKTCKIYKRSWLRIMTWGEYGSGWKELLNYSVSIFYSYLPVYSQLSSFEFFLFFRDVGVRQLFKSMESGYRECMTEIIFISLHQFVHKRGRAIHSGRVFASDIPSPLAPFLLLAFRSETYSTTTKGASESDCSNVFLPCHPCLLLPSLPKF